MDRRTFLTSLGAGAVGLTGLSALSSCSSPERDLLEGRAADPAQLQPRGDDLIAGEADGDELAVEARPLPVDVPDEDLVGISFTAWARDAEIDVYAGEDDAVATWTFANPLASGGPLVFLIPDLTGNPRQRVLLPVRPNGTYGWVDTADVDLEYHNYSILVELSEFRLTLFDHGEPTFSTLVGVARENAPTPDGIYYTTELLEPVVPSTIYGAYAYGLSGYSETLEEFAGGPGQLGLHGTNDPSSLGTQVSSGCIRMHDDEITHLVEDIGLPVGVPVEVRA
jgi:hypothetical protein